MKILHCSDLHVDVMTHGQVDSDTGGNTAYRSNMRVVKFIADTAIERKVEALLITGDLTAAGRPHIEVVLNLVDLLTPVAKAGIPIVLVDGNHEAIGVPVHARTVSRMVAQLLAPFGRAIVTSREPRTVMLDGVAFMCAPWPSKPRVLSQMGARPATAAEGDQLVATWMVERIDALAADLPAGTPSILASHMTVGGDALTEPGSEREIPRHLFTEPILPLAFVESLPTAYNAFGHIHTPQKLGEKTYYAGAPNRLTFADAGHTPSINLVTVTDADSLAEVEIIPTPARTMQQLSIENIDQAEPGSVVKIILPPGEVSLPDEAAAALAERGVKPAVIVRTPPPPPQRSAPALAETISDADALDAWLSIHRPDADHDAVVALASELA